MSLIGHLGTRIASAAKENTEVEGAGWVAVPLSVGIQRAMAFGPTCALGQREATVSPRGAGGTIGFRESASGASRRRLIGSGRPGCGRSIQSAGRASGIRP